MSGQEEWRLVPGHPLYSVSTLGRIRSERSGRLLRGTLGANGYRYVVICDAPGRMQTTLHSLVLLTFVGPRPEGQLTRHLDGDKTNNRLTNLAYGTPLENNLDTVRHGGNNNARKTECPKGHPYDEHNTIWRTAREPWKGPYRLCRACRQEIESPAARAARAAAKGAAA